MYLCQNQESTNTTKYPSTTLDCNDQGASVAGGDDDDGDDGTIADEVSDGLNGHDDDDVYDADSTSDDKNHADNTDVDYDGDDDDHDNGVDDNGDTVNDKNDDTMALMTATRMEMLTKRMPNTMLIMSKTTTTTRFRYPMQDISASLYGLPVLAIPQVHPSHSLTQHKSHTTKHYTAEAGDPHPTPHLSNDVIIGSAESGRIIAPAFKDRDLNAELTPTGGVDLQGLVDPNYTYVSIHPPSVVWGFRLLHT